MGASTTLNQLIRDTTEDYLDELDEDALPDQIEHDLLARVNRAIEKYNMGPEDPTASANAKSYVRFPDQKPKDERARKLQALTPAQIAQIIAKRHQACRLATVGENADKDYDMLGLYQSEGDNEGIYVASEDDFHTIARKYNYGLKDKDFKEIMSALRDMVPRRALNSDPDLVAVNNGILNYATKELMPFSPEYVFMTKSHVDFVPNAPNPIIHNDEDGTDWDVVSWMNDLSDDPEIVELLWQILGAIVRPRVSWNKSAWLYSTVGNNGKGTLCALMRNLCGAGAYASIPLKDFGQDFMLEPLTHASAIIVDENDVGTYIDQAANLKAVITNDVISINRKYKSPIAYQFHGFMVQCMNEFPKVRDRSGSFYRRQLFIPMEKRFEGRERKYIKSDYLARKEVLEYVLWHVLGETDYYELKIPAACEAVLAEYKVFNDPCREFFKELEENATWDLLPFSFIWDAYVGWIRKNNPQGKPLGRYVLLREIKQLAAASDIFYYDPSEPQYTARGRMDAPEPAIAELDLKGWMDTTYSGNDLSRKCSPRNLSKSYRGLIRKTAPDDDDTTDSNPDTNQDDAQEGGDE